jgi:DNA-binding transcriptional ArsR family regulator
MAINVPMTDDLANEAIPTSTAEAQRIWDDYSGPWQVWNTVRTAFSEVSLVLAALGLARPRRQPNAGAAHGGTGRPSRARRTHRTNIPAAVIPPKRRLSSRLDEGELEPCRLLPSATARDRSYNQMVVELLSPPETDKVFHALADATRRDIVRTVLVQGHSVSALARRYPMSITAVQKHVAVLEAAGLVTRQRRGRESLVQGDIDRVRDARNALDAFEQLWRDRVAQMDQILAEDP